MIYNFNNLFIQKLGNNNILFTDYNSHDKLEDKDIEYAKVRGNVRLFLQRVITWSDIKKLTTRLFSEKLP